MELSTAMPKDEWQHPSTQLSRKEHDGHWDHTWAAFGKISLTKNKRSTSLQIQSRFWTQRRTKTVGTSRSVVAADRRLCDIPVKQPYLVRRLEHAYSIESFMLMHPVCLSPPQAQVRLAYMLPTDRIPTHMAIEVRPSCSSPLRVYLVSGL
jgi:hypothetical protein